MARAQDLLSDILFTIPFSSDLVAMTGLPVRRCLEIFELRDPTFRHPDEFSAALKEVMSSAKDADLMKFLGVDEEWVADARATVETTN